MLTVHDYKPPVEVEVDKVGVRNLEVPVIIDLLSPIINSDISFYEAGEKEVQQRIANISVYATLPSSQKGAHLSRFPQIMSEATSLFPTSIREMTSILSELCHRVESTKVYLKLRFDPFLSAEMQLQNNLVTSFQCTVPMTYELSYEPQSQLLKRFVAFELKGFNVCPCALKECGGVASHSQKALLRVHLDLTVKPEELNQPARSLTSWKDLFSDLIKASFSAPVGTVLKRDQEAGTILDGFSNPRFVEDSCRLAADYLSSKIQRPFSVVVDSDESITHHSAVAVILNGMP